MNDSNGQSLEPGDLVFWLSAHQGIIYFYVVLGESISISIETDDVFDTVIEYECPTLKLLELSRNIIITSTRSENFTKI